MIRDFVIQLAVAIAGLSFMLYFYCPVHGKV